MHARYATETETRSKFQLHIPTVYYIALPARPSLSVSVASRTSMGISIGTAFSILQGMH